ncbi:MAG: hypothetical protein DRO13_03465 [Thermoprotei archaeon]|nr:MAG: hypothetical protein DRO13_03465 [Thermoprotei archaeon]
MHILGSLVYHVFRSLFVTGEKGIRLAHPFAKAFFIFSTLSLFSTGYYSSLAFLLVATMLLGAVSNGYRWLYSSSILALIPSAWYAITAYLLVLAGLPYSYGLLDIALIGLRTYTLSLLILLYASMVSPARLYNILLRIGAKRLSVAPILTWRIVPQGLVYVLESLAIGRVKGESASKRLAPAMASLLELGEYVRIASYYKIYGTPSNKIPVSTSMKYSVVLVAVSIASILLAYCIAT